MGGLTKEEKQVVTKEQAFPKYPVNRSSTCTFRGCLFHVRRVPPDYGDG